MSEFAGICVLYIEDDPDIADLAQRHLHRAGYVVDTAPDGVTGLALYADHRYDVVTVDQHIPRLAGLDVIRALTAHTPAPTIIMVTGTGDEQTAVEAMKLGASDYLVKDTEGGYLELLPVVIERALRQRQIADQKRQAEEALRESQALLQGLLDYAPATIYVKDSHGRFLLVNRQFASWLKLHPWQMVGKSQYDLFPAEIATAWAEQDQQIITTCEPVEFEETLEINDGRWRTYLTIKFPLYDAQGHVYAVGAVCNDITERKHLEEILELRVRERTVQLEATSYQLQRNRDLLQTIFDGINDGLLLLNQSGYIMTANQAMCVLLGRSLEQLIDQSWAAFCQTPEINQIDTEISFPGLWVLDTLQDGLPRRQRERFVLNGATTRVLDLHALPIYSANTPATSGQAVDRVVLHVVDVTEQLQLEALMIENERFAASKRLTQIVAHEVNSPLQTIMFSLDMLLRKTSNSEQQAFLNVAQEEVERIGKILHQLKDIYHTPDNNSVTRDVNALLERVLLLTGGKLAQNHIVVERDLVDDLPSILCSPDQLMQVFLNLILNAIDAMPDGGKLYIKTNVQMIESKHMVIIEITDTGIGIEDNIKSRIFEPFFTTKSHGSGLGLSVSQKIIKAARGSLEVHSTVGQGTTFRIILPIYGEQAE